ncbi:MAG: exonuclease [Nocardioidaceae bacterium]|nr:exonuclease [Nocardioidaceae bacterium]
MEQSETFVSVDVETAGPVPSQHSLLSIGACLAERPDEGFYVELRPEHAASEPGALAVSGLSLADLARDGTPPEQAMRDFATWLERVVPDGSRPVFVALNAPFDWMFVSDAFARHLGHNPFGYSALDIKAYYMGLTGVPWARTGMRDLGPAYLGGRELTHNALADARDQAEIFTALLHTERRTTPRRNGHERERT